MFRRSVPKLAHLRLRAAALHTLRRFFVERGYLEVETPILSPHASMEPHLRSFRTTLHSVSGETCPLYLQTSPEYALKRVLGAHPGTHLFQIAQVFRDEEGSATHHHEFTLIEWYRCHADYRYLMDETEALVQEVARAHAPSWPRVRFGEHEIDCSQPFARITVRDAFLEHAHIDIARHTTANALRTEARRAGCEPGDDWSWEDIFHLVLLERVEPRISITPTFLYDYPEPLAALARTAPREEEGLTYRVAERFELYMCGLELCNGFSELTDVAEQRRRFEAEQALRAELGRPVHSIDEALLEGIERMPPCTGNALGLDRLLMLVMGVESVQDTRVV